jgi:hypothetical protein
MSEYEVLLRGEYVEDDGVEIDMGAPEAGESKWSLPLPHCPDCGGDLVWWEAGNVPGTRKCVGLPVGGRPTNPALDARVPLPDGAQHRGHGGMFPHGPIGDQARRLFEERNVCDSRVEEHRSDPGVESGRTVRPHMRRAHSHLYWTGEGRKQPRVRFLLPISVRGGRLVEEPAQPTEIKVR